MSHRTGTIKSGDVTLFYRHFGKGGATPIIILHGANYYDSADWIDVASALATDREVVAYDKRGFGESTWSPSKDYSHDAISGDIAGLLQHFGWKKAIIMGHSAGGGESILFAARNPGSTAALILVDHCPGRAGSAVPGTGNKLKVYPTAEAALADTSRDKSVQQPARLEKLFKPVEGGFAFKRDPDFGSKAPVTPGWTPKIAADDMWKELAAVKAPTLIIRGTKSDRYNDATVARVAKEFPQIQMVNLDCGHDVAGAAPRELIQTTQRFVAERVDAGKAAAE
jgi:pimeloyl-ACP methyl ester carboxylesterase